MDNIVVVKLQKTNKSILEFYKNNILELRTAAYIGRNGMTTDKIEGDGKTPIGIFKLGLAFGTHKRENIKLAKSIKYIRLNNNLYWIDDPNSKFYNKMVDASKVKKNWNSSEHLIKYSKQYEYAIEIKANPQNIKEGRKCNIFALQC